MRNESKKVKRGWLSNLLLYLRLINQLLLLVTLLAVLLFLGLFWWNFQARPMGVPPGGMQRGPMQKDAPPGFAKDEDRDKVERAFPENKDALPKK